MKDFNFSRKGDREDLELLIIGAGAAGISAAIYASLLDITYVLIDAEEGGGLLNLAKTVENYPGVTGRRGPEMTAMLLDHLREVGGRLSPNEPAVEFDLSSPGEFMVRTTINTYHPRTIILATGLELLGLKQSFHIPDERSYIGKGISYCTACDGPLFKGKTVLVVGNPFEAFMLERLCRKVYYLGPIPEEYAAQIPQEVIEANNIEYREGPITGLEGHDFLTGVRVNGSCIPVDGLFMTQKKGSSEVLEKSGLKLDDSGFVIVNRHMETNIPGVFAAGDITGEPWQISKSVGEGAVAALSAFRYLTGQEMRNLGWALQEEWKHPVRF